MIAALCISAVFQSAIEQEEIRKQNRIELLKGHCAATDIDGRALIYTCDGGKHVVRY